MEARMSQTRKFLIASAAVVLVSALIALAYSQEASPAASAEDQEEFERLARLYGVIEQNYYEEPGLRQLFSGALNGMLHQLDPHSVFVDAVDYAALEEQYRGNYQGIGVSFIILDEKITVMEVLPGGPSERAGLEMGDQIVEIEGESALGLDGDEVQRRLRGPADTRVSVGLERPHHAELIPVTITRGEIPILSVDNCFMLDEETGYIHVSRFARPTARELETGLRQLDGRGMRRLVLDLRGNTGGLLQAAILVADKFLSGRRLIVYTDGRVPDARQSFYSQRETKSWDLPLVVLIDHVSASASEIVAGALQDWDRAVIAGQTSFGKGLVQTGFILGDRSRLLLTTSRYYTPSGRLIQRDYKGVDLETYQMQGLDDYDPNDVDIGVPSGERPMVSTATGRPVYGGGGITPDEVIEGELMFDRFVYSLSNQLIVFLYARDYFWRHRQMPMSFEEFRDSFAVSDAMLAELLELAREREFAYYPMRGEALSDSRVEEQFWELADQLRLVVKAEIAQFYFGRGAGFRLRRTARDNQLAGARRFFERAAELAQLQGRIDPDVFAARRATGGNDE